MPPIRSPLECAAGTIVKRMPCVSTVPPAFIPMTSAASPSWASRYRLSSWTQGIDGCSRRASDSVSASKWSKCPWVRHSTSHRACAVDGVGAVRVAVPRVDQHHLPAGRGDLHARVPEPRELRVPPDRHRSLLPPGRRSRSSRGCPLSAGRPRPGSRLHSARARGTDRDEPRAHQLDAADRPRRGVVRGRRAGAPRDPRDQGLSRLHGRLRGRLRRARLPVRHRAADARRGPRADRPGVRRAAPPRAAGLRAARRGDHRSRSPGDAAR